MTKIYNSWNPTISSFIGHMDDAGIVYNHWSHEGIEDSVGHVDKDGVVYNHWSREGISDSVGHVDKDGVVYSHWSRESIEDSVGHVGKDGVVYSHWSREGIGDSVGCVEGGNIYAAGAAFLLLNDSFYKTDFDDEEPPKSDPKHINEQAEREYQRRLAEERARLRREAYQRYASNPRIVAAAKDYAQQRKKTATILAPIFFAMLCIGGFRKITGETFIPVIAVVGLYILLMTLFVRHMTYKNAFKQKVWELGEQGYGSESVEQPPPKGNQPTADSEATHTPDPEPKPAGNKIVACPHCGAKCKIPIGIGTIKITCPNPGCNGKTFIIES